ncbi:MAG: UPF0158 family protein [Thermodesulfobacteriota bacterium]
MAISFDDIENAFLFVSMDQQFMHNAFLCKETGQIFYTSEFGDSDELPEDIDYSEKYIAIPHKNELELGKALVFEYVSKYLPEEFDRVNSIFRKPGAYSRFKALLDRTGLLDKWYEFENERQRNALRQWCIENNIELED